MQLAPLPGLAAVLLGILFTLPEYLQAGAVQHDMNGPIMSCDTRLASSESTAASAERGVIRHGQIQSEQAQGRAREAFGLTQRQMEDEPQRQHQFDRHVGIQRLATARRPTWRTPSRQCRLIQPEGQVATPPQARLIDRPVGDPPTHLGMRWRRDALCLKGIQGV